ncbi:MAG: hypothetical protein J6U93_00895 [Alistipes sp.]|nr:hypothetical protein [Alistipes sp.]
MLTAHKVQTDIMALLADSELCAELSGEVYRNGYRPRDSRLEDIVVTFVAGTPAQVERGAVTLNIFVPDITPYNNGVYVEDGQRTSHIEVLADHWVQSLTTSRANYKFKLLRTISTDNDEAIHQHFVVVQLEYQFKD